LKHGKCEHAVAVTPRLLLFGLQLPNNIGMTRRVAET
jgi:hypothetical protein